MGDAPFRLYDHVDLRVRDLANARAFYDPLMRALGLRGRPALSEGRVWTYLRVHERTAHEAFTLTQGAAHAVNAARIAFGATTREDVDRVADVARLAGATNYEAPHLCPEYAPTYYAAFFDDPDGNKLEVVVR